MNKRMFLAAGGIVGLIGLGLIVAPLFGGAGKGEIDLKLVNKSTVISAAYKVYGSPDGAGGKYWLGKMTLKNSGHGPLKDVKISYQIPDFVPWTTPEVYPEVLPGQAVVTAIYPKLPAKVAQISSMTPSNLEVKIEYDDGTGPKSRIESRKFDFRGVREIEYSSLPQSEIVDYYDMHDNSELNCAWVTEEDDAVRLYYGRIAKQAGGFGTMDSAKDVRQLAQSVYNFMVSTGMTYSGTKGLVEKKGSEYVLVQSMRLPRDLINANTGLCVELAQLWASIAINSGARCYLVFVPGHCFPALVSGDGQILPIEATGISGGFEGGNLGAPMTFEQALESGAKSFAKLQNGQTVGLMIDVLEYRNKGIRPPELPAINVENFNAMLDKRVEGARGAPTPPIVAGGGGGNPGGGGAVNPGGGGTINPGGGGGGVPPLPVPGPGANGIVWRDARGRVSMTYPPGWQTNPQLVTQMQQIFPGYSLSVVDPRSQCGIEIIFFDGLTEHGQAVSTVRNALSAMGVNVNVGASTSENIGTKNMTVVPLVLNGPTGTVAGALGVVSIRGGLVVVNAGGPAANVAAAMPEIERVLDTIKFAD